MAPAILIQATIQPRLPTSQPGPLQASNLQSTSSLATIPLPPTKSTQGMVPDPSTVTHKASSMPFFSSSRARAPVSVISTTWGLFRSWSYLCTSLVSPLKSQRFPNFPRLSCRGFFLFFPFPSPRITRGSSEFRRCLYLTQEGTIDTWRPQGCPGALKGDLGQGPCPHARLLSLLAGRHSRVEEFSRHLQERAGGIRGERTRCCREGRGGAGNGPGDRHRAPALTWATQQRL